MKKIFNLLFFVTEKVIPYLFILSVFIILAEIFSHPGVLFINSIYLLNIFILITFIYLLFNSKKANGNACLNTILNTNQIFFPFFLFLWFLMNSFEFNNYPNYVYSQFGIYLSQLNLLVYLSASLFCLFSLKEMIKFINQNTIFNNYPKNSYKSILIIVSFFLIGSTFIYHSFATITNLLPTLAPIIESPLASYEEKMYKIDKLTTRTYQYSKFINSYTSEDSTIIVPALNSFHDNSALWGKEVNPNFIRYFVYPRKVVVYKEDQNILDQGDYIIYLYGESEEDKQIYHWPDKDIPIEEMWMFNFESEKSYEVKDFPTIENYQQISKLEDWGLIKIKK